MIFCPLKGGLATEALARLCVIQPDRPFGSQRKEKMEQNNMSGADMRLLSIPEACERLGIGRYAIYQNISKRTLKSIKIGRRRLVSNRAIVEFVNESEA